MSVFPRQDPDESQPARGGEHWDAFEAFVREQYPALCAYAYRYVRSREAAEEVVQDVLLRVWCRRDRLAQVEVVPYVYRSVVHAAISKTRAERTIRSRDLRLRLELEGHVPAEEPDGAADLEEQVRQAIQALPERCRLVFLLSRDAGLTYSAIAERLGISPKTVENQIVHALRLLRAALRAHLAVALTVAAAGVDQLLRKLL